MITNNLSPNGPSGRDIKYILEQISNLKKSQNDNADSLTSLTSQLQSIITEGSLDTINVPNGYIGKLVTEGLDTAKSATIRSIINAPSGQDEDGNNLQAWYGIATYSDTSPYQWRPELDVAGTLLTTEEFKHIIPIGTPVEVEGTIDASNEVTATAGGPAITFLDCSILNHSFQLLVQWLDKSLNVLYQQESKDIAALGVYRDPITNKTTLCIRFEDQLFVDNPTIEIIMRHWGINSTAIDSYKIDPLDTLLLTQIFVSTLEGYSVSNINFESLSLEELNVNNATINNLTVSSADITSYTFQPKVIRVTRDPSLLLPEEDKADTLILEGNSWYEIDEVLKSTDSATGEVQIVTYKKENVNYDPTTEKYTYTGTGDQSFIISAAKDTKAYLNSELGSNYISQHSINEYYFTIGPATAPLIPDPSIPMWDVAIQYNALDTVNYNGYLYTAGNSTVVGIPPDTTLWTQSTLPTISDPSFIRVDDFYITAVLMGNATDITFTPVSEPTTIWDMKEGFYASPITSDLIDVAQLNVTNEHIIHGIIDNLTVENTISGVAYTLDQNGSLTAPSGALLVDSISANEIHTDSFSAEEVHQDYSAPLSLSTVGWYQLADLTIFNQGNIYITATDGSNIEKDTIQINGTQIIDSSQGSLIDQAAIDSNYYYIHIASPLDITYSINGTYDATTSPIVITDTPVTLPSDAIISSFIDKVRVSEYLFSDKTIGAVNLRANTSIKSRNYFRTLYPSFNSIDQYPPVDSYLTIPESFNFDAATSYSLIDLSRTPNGSMLISDSNESLIITWANGNYTVSGNPTTIWQIGVENNLLYLASMTNAVTRQVSIEATIESSTLTTAVFPFIPYAVQDASTMYALGTGNINLLFGGTEYKYIGNVSFDKNINLNGNLTIAGDIIGDVPSIQKVNRMDASIVDGLYSYISTVITDGGSNYVSGDEIYVGTAPSLWTFTVSSIGTGGSITSLTATTTPDVNIDYSGLQSTTTNSTTGTGATLTLTVASSLNTSHYPSTQAVVNYINEQKLGIIILDSAADFNALVIANNLIPNATYGYPDAATTQVIDDSITANNATWSSYHIDAELNDIDVKLQQLSIAVIFIGHYNFLTATPTTTQLNEFVETARPDLTTVPNGATVINDYDNHRWVFDTVWVDMGINSVTNWSNLSPGLIKGTAPDTVNMDATFGTIQAQSNGEAKLNHFYLDTEATYNNTLEGFHFIIKEED